MSEPRILIAGVGNVFLGDDGFGVEVVRRLAAPPPGVRVSDFGIRGFDLALALVEPHDLVVLVDAVRRGGTPGTLYLMEAAERPEDPPELEAHGMAPRRVFGAAKALGAELSRILVVACEPEDFGDPETGRMGLSPRVAAAVPEAVGMIDSLVKQALAERESHA